MKEGKKLLDRGVPIRSLAMMVNNTLNLLGFMLLLIPSAIWAATDAVDLFKHFLPICICSNII
jgi:hypothetical protein